MRHTWYTLIVKTIGCVNSILSGLMIEDAIRCFIGRTSWPGKLYFSPDSFSMSSHLRCKMIGAYDSFKNAHPIAVLIPQIIVKIQNTQRQPSFSTTTPPSSGPIVGPRSGPSRYHPKILARSCGVHISLIVPPPFAIPTLPKKPESVRTATSVATFGLNAVGIWRSVKMVKQIRYSFLLPNVSESGASISGPMPSITTKPVVAPTTCVLSHRRSSAI